MTQESKAALDAFFADNITGLITPSMQRDFLDSMVPSRGSLYVTTPAATAIAVPGTYYKAAGVTTLVAGYRLSMPSDNRLLYAGPATVDANVTANLSVLCAADAQVLGFGIALNGVVIPSSVIEHKIITGADIVAVSLSAETPLAATDYLELWVTNGTSVGTVTLQRAYMSVLGLIAP